MGFDVLHTTALGGNVEILDLLMRREMRVTDKPSGAYQDSIHSHAAAFGHEKMVEAIIILLPNLLHKNSDYGFSPVQRSVQYQQLGVLKKKGASEAPMYELCTLQPGKTHASRQ
jgi:hypothetical protein